MGRDAFALNGYGNAFILPFVTRRAYVYACSLSSSAGDIRKRMRMSSACGCRPRVDVVRCLHKRVSSSLHARETAVVRSASRGMRRPGTRWPDSRSLTRFSLADTIPLSHPAGFTFHRCKRFRFPVFSTNEETNAILADKRGCSTWRMFGECRKFRIHPRRGKKTIKI